MMASQKFNETFWEEIKTLFPIQYENSFLTVELSTLQKQAVIRLVEKKAGIKDL